MTTQNDYSATLTSPAENDFLRIPPFVLPLLTTRCLATAAIFQGLGTVVPIFSALLPIGLVLSAIGLGAYACVRSGQVHNGWAFLGFVPVFGLLIGYTVLQRRAPTPEAPLNAVKGAVHTLVLGLILAVSMMALYAFTQSGYEIQGEVPDDFPVLFVIPADNSSYSAHVVPKRNFDEFTRQHPDYSFLVPKHLEATLRESLEAGSEYMFQSPTFEVTDSSAERQRFKVRNPIHDEARSIGWYEASAQSIEPTRYLMFHDMMLGVFVFPVFIMTGMMYSIVSWLLNRRIWPRLARFDGEATDES